VNEIIKRVNELMDAIPYKNEFGDDRKKVINGKWCWHGLANQSVTLSTERGGRQYLLSTLRKGFNGSQFQVRTSLDGFGIMEPASKFYVPRAEYARNTVVDIDNPVCQRIKIIPDMVNNLNELQARIKELEAKA